MLKKKTVGLFAKKNPFKDRSEWSGTVFSICQSLLCSGFEVRWIPYKACKWRWILLNFSMRLLHGLHCKIRRLPYYAKICADSVDQELLDGCDYCFFPGGGEMIPFLKTSIPTIYLIDATYKQLENYYYLNVSQWCSKVAFKYSQQVYDSCTRIIVSSAWARTSLVKDYGQAKEKVCCLPFGANMSDNEIHPYIRSWNEGEELKILFSGVDWERKGGDVAVETVEELRRCGLNVQLYIVGIKKIPVKYQNIAYITNMGFLSKNDKEQYEQYLELFRTCHLLLLPTKAECSAIVFCEASAFGLPSFTYNTGGLADYVINGYNGYRLPPNATATDFAEIIIKALGSFQVLSKNAIAHYHKKLNWRYWGNSFAELINTI